MGLELQFEKKSCQYLRYHMRQTREQEQTQEVRLPEGMPDIGEILGAWGQCVMRSKEWNSDSIGVSGGIMAWILYAGAEGGELKTLEVWLPIQLKWNMPEAKRNGIIRCNWLLKGVDGRVLSARKMMVRANVSVSAEALEPCEAEISTEGRVPQDVQLLKRTYPAKLNVEAGEKTFLLDEEIVPVMGAPAPEQIIYCSVRPQLTDRKVIGGKAVMRGNACFSMLYRAGDGGVHAHEQMMEFSQFSDLDRDYEAEAELSAELALSSLETELQEGRVRIKCGMVAQYLVRDMVMLELTQDAYSPCRKVKPDREELRLPMVLDLRQEALEYSCSLSRKAARVVDVSVNPEQPTVRRAGDLAQIVIGGPVQVLYYDENGTLCSGSGRFNAQWELPAAEDMELYAGVQSVDRMQAVLSSDRIDLNGQLRMEVTAIGRQPLEMVTGMEMDDPKEPDPDRPSLVLVRVGSRDLWQVAKQTGSTVKAIMEANGLTAEPQGDMLLLVPVS